MQEYPQLIETETFKNLVSPEYNYSFNKKNGFFVRWGKTLEDNPTWSKFGPEIADIEITTICNGVRDKEGNRSPCKFCYKSNGPVGNNMSFETFKKIFHNLPKTLNQIAFGVDSEARSNPELFNMMNYCRHNSYQDIIPNITISDIDETTAKRIIEVAGAVSVSCYMDRDKNICYNIVERLNEDLKQVNIHMMLSKETLEYTKELFNDYKTDKRLSKTNAIILLSLKQKGRGINYTPLDQKDFDGVLKLAFKNKITLGFDSCTCPKFLNSMRKNKKYQIYFSMSEPCESGIFSLFINVNGMFQPCSFINDFSLDVVNCEDFIKDIWMNKETIKWRNKLINNTDEHEIRCCPVYKI